MTKSRARRDEPQPEDDQLVVRGILGDTGLDRKDLRDAAMMNDELYGFCGISVWIPNAEYPLARLEQTKLVNFDQYAEFAVCDLLTRELALWATGQSPHYDVVHNDIDSLVELVLVTPHHIRSNLHVERTQ